MFLAIHKSENQYNTITANLLTVHMQSTDKQFFACLANFTNKRWSKAFCLCFFKRVICVPGDSGIDPGIIQGPNSQTILGHVTIL